MQGALVVAVVIATLLVVIFRGSGNERRSRPVLPSHYDVERYVVQYDPARCEGCGERNDPQYQFCKACARSLPKVSR